MVLARNNGEAFGFQHVYAHLVNVQDNDLVGALSNLPFLIEHEATSKCEDLVEVRYRSVALTAFNGVGASFVVDAFPDDTVTGNLCLHDFFNGFEVQATDQEGALFAGDKGRALTGCRCPLRFFRRHYVYSEALSLLGTLHE